MLQCWPDLPGKIQNKCQPGKAEKFSGKLKFFLFFCQIETIGYVQAGSYCSKKRPAKLAGPVISKYPLSE
jgi:hypothetical protein